MKFYKEVTLTLLALGLFAPSAPAVISLDPQFSGTLIITSPGGEVTLFEAGDKVPEILSKSTIEVFDGSFTLSTQPGDQVQVGCFGEGHAVGGGSSASLTCGDNSGLLKIDGKEIPIAGVKAPVEAAPTAESAATGVPADQGAAPAPDSRSIQASPAQ